MAKTSAIAKNERRKATSEKFAQKRATLLSVLRDPNKSWEERDEAARKLRKLPRDVNPNRVRNRCMLTGRSRAYLRKFGLCRNQFRELSLLAEIPGIRKASW
jgi:small subunit ribosomal protein S14